MTRRLLIVGAGGHAKVVAEAARLAGFQVVGFLDRDPARHGSRWLDLPVLGDESVLEKPDYRDCDVVIAIGDNRDRETVVRRCAAHSHRFATVIHPAAVISPTASLGTGTVVFAGVIVNSSTVVGDHCILNSAACIEHDNVIEDFAHISPGAHLAGECRVGRSAHVGIGAALLPTVSVGQGTVIGAGAVVLRDLPPGVVAVGVPARIIRSP